MLCSCNKNSGTYKVPVSEAEHFPRSINVEIVGLHNFGASRDVVAEIRYS
jgi:hypothetical protein